MSLSKSLKRKNSTIIIFILFLNIKYCFLIGRAHNITSFWEKYEQGIIIQKIPPHANYDMESIDLTQKKIKRLIYKKINSDVYYGFFLSTTLRNIFFIQDKECVMLFITDPSNPPPKKSRIFLNNLYSVSTFYFTKCTIIQRDFNPSFLNSPYTIQKTYPLGGDSSLTRFYTQERIKLPDFYNEKNIIYNFNLMKKLDLEVDNLVDKGQRLSEQTFGDRYSVFMAGNCFK